MTTLHPSVFETSDGGMVVINPGTGGLNIPHTEAQARLNMRQFIQDSHAQMGIASGLHWRRSRKRDYGDGRYAFMVTFDECPGVRVEVQMPGYVLVRVRPDDLDNYDTWEFPRLYIDGSRWLWQYAILDYDVFTPDDDGDG